MSDRTVEVNAESRDQNFQPIVSQNKPSVPLIQRKVDSSQALPSSNFADEKTPYLSLETQINQTANSPSEIPLVSPQTTSEELDTTEKMPRQAKFIDSKTASANLSQFNPNYPSPSNTDEGSIINQNSTSSSEI